MNGVALNLPEELLILALHDGKAKPLNLSLSFGLAGAVIAELLLEEKISRSGLTLVSRNPSPPADPILSEVLAAIPSSAEARTVKDLVNYLNRRIKSLRPKLTEQLVHKGLVQRSEQRVLGVFSYKNYQLADEHVALRLKDQLRQVIFRPFTPSPRQLALIGLIQPSGLKIFTREERTAAKQRIAEVLNSEVIGKAVAQSVADFGAAAAVIAASAASSY